MKTGRVHGSSSAPAAPDIGTEIRDDNYSGPSGPRIRCPFCKWSPGKDDRWSCTCGHAWNTFDTGGVCPSCMHQWSETQCLACRRWSAHSEWYEY